MISPVVASVGHGYTALWYLTRASGLVSLVLLSATVVLGIVASVGWTTERWPRFLSQSMHRNLSLFCIGFVALHVVTTVADGYVPIGFLDAVIPFQTPYRPLWVGFGALTLDLLLAVAITSGLRKQIGVRAWRGVHWLAYLCWPIALLHGLGSGSDTRLSLALLVNVICVVAVVAAVGWRLVTGRTFSPGRRIVAAVVGALGLTAIGITAALGPLRPGWSHRAGTSPALLTQLNASFASGGTSSSATAAPAPTVAPTPSTSAPSTNDAVPVPPFTRTVTGTYRTSATNQSGQVSVVLSMTPSGAPTTPLTVTLIGTSVNGGVAMSSSQITWGQDTGSVTALQGSTIGATVKGPHGSVQLSMHLSLDQAHGTLSGTLTGSTTNGTG
ncbi:MAG TPA: ferric reductase-like transmembrane domain-containing protein [Acidimicrobiales bacterium]|jgi:DMSO/TMAO reductase YedYZ heme-binding membrane subunit|nr:ferric reductase-like transmembrane domain-containing protein [Acidimicrobiales bacterium]